MTRETLERFDAFLAAQGLRLEAVVVGGAALGLLGITTRQTRDCDIVHPELPAAVLAAARGFAGERRAAGDALADDWLNNGPRQLTEVLPEGWQQRVQAAFDGTALRLLALGRPDLLKTKLFALCDRGLDLPDCLALAPSAAELGEAEEWLVVQDGHPGWPAHVRETLADLQRRRDDAV